MEIFIKKLLNGVEVENKLSLFQDEQIILTKNWQNQQVIAGYGSYSNSFSVPVDSNNSEIFNYYNLVYGHYANSTQLFPSNVLNPNYTLKAKIVVNEFELVGNIQLVGFTMKEDQYFSFILTFFSYEKNLIWYLNKSEPNKINNIPLDGLAFQFNKENVIDTWSGDNKVIFVPLMATEREFNYRDVAGPNNINSIVSDTLTGISYIQRTTGITMDDLKVSYNLKTLHDKFFQNFDLTIEHSSGVTDFLNNLYLMPNPKTEDKSVSDLTYIFLKAFETNTIKIDNDVYNIFSLTTGSTTSTGKLLGNLDNTSWQNINDYTDISGNYYKAATAGLYNFKFTFNSTINLPQRTYSTVFLVDRATNAFLKSDIINLNSSKDLQVQLIQDQEVIVLIDYWFFYITPDYKMQISTNYFRNKDNVRCQLKIEKATQLNYDYIVSGPNFSDMLVSDFWLNFCKSFNIFFEYDENLKKVKTYFKGELPRNFYDFTQYLLLDKVYTFNNEPKYKLISYQFKEATDINNITYKKANILEFGRYKENFNYDLGIDKLEYTSIFSVFPKTVLNYTNENNSIISATNLTLHSEIDESYNPINTDFLLFYKKPISWASVNYNIQNSATGFTNEVQCSDYSPDGDSIYSLDYNVFPEAIENNKNQRFEVTLEFLVPSNILYNLKIYDILVIRNIYYEIQNVRIDIETGYSVFLLKTLDLTYGDIVNIPPDPWEKSATIPCDCAKPTITNVTLISGSTVQITVDYDIAIDCVNMIFEWSKDLTNWTSGSSVCVNVINIDITDVTGTTYFRVMSVCDVDCQYTSSVYAYQYIMPTTTTTSTTLSGITTTTTTLSPTTTTTTTVHICDLVYTIDSIDYVCDLDYTIDTIEEI